MASLTRWKLPKSRSGRRPISVAKLLERDGEGLLFKKHSALGPPTHDYDWADSEIGTTGIPAQLAKKRTEVPTRDEVEVSPTPKVENRQDGQGTITVGSFTAPGGSEDLGKTGAMKDKISRAMETLGELSRTWEVPSDDDDQTGAQQVDRHGPFGITMSQISAATDVEATKTASGREVGGISFEAFVEELGQLGAVTEGQLQKVAEVTREQAQQALQHLDHLESERPTLGQLARGAAVGSVVGPVASNVSKLISAGHLHTPREVAGQVAGGVIFGTATPLLKHKVETGTERRTLKDYVNSGHGGRLVSQIENKLETP